MATDLIAKRAALFSHLATALLLILPCAAVWVLATQGISPEALRQALGISVMPDDPGAGPILIWALVEATRLALLMWVIWSVRAWLRACASGRVFADRTARDVQRIGAGLLALTAAHILGHTISVAALTWGNPVGERVLSVRLGSTELFLLLAAGLMTLFGWIQAEAARLAAENERFV